MPCVTRGLGLSDSTRIRGFTTHDHDLKDPKILTSEVFYLPKGQYSALAMLFPACLADES